MEKLTGYTAKELVGRSSPFPWWPEGKAQTYSLRKKLLENGELIIHDRQYIDKNGKVFYISGTVRPIKEKGQNKVLPIQLDRCHRTQTGRTGIAGE